MPCLSASQHAALSGVVSCATEIQELLPGILNQMGPDSLNHLKKVMQQVRHHGSTRGVAFWRGAHATVC